MSNQTFFDKPFITDRLNECLSLLEFQVQRCLDGLPVNADLCEKASESFFNFFRHVEVYNGFTDAERTELMFRFFGLKGAIEELQNVEQPEVRQANDSAAQPVAPTQLSVLRVLGQVSKTQSYSRPADSLSRHWLPAPASAAGLFSSTRSIGGLGQ